jgi:signal transduction histidine kinase
MNIDALIVSILTLACIRLLGMLVFIHLYHQKRDKKYILLVAGWLCLAAGSTWSLYTLVVLGAMDHYFSSLLAGLGTLWILFGSLLYFDAIQWRYIYFGSIMIVLYGSLPLFGLSLGPSPGVLVQFFISLILIFIAIFKRKVFISYAQSSYFWLILLAVSTNLLTLSFLLGFIQSMALGFAGTSIVTMVAIIFFLHIEYNISTRSLKKSKEEYHSMITNLMEGFYSVSFDGTLLDYNMEFIRILNLDPKTDHHGIKLQLFWQNPADRKAYQDELLKSGAIRNYEINTITATGKEITVLVSARLVKREEDKSLRIDGSFLDITSRKNTTDELNELKNKLEETVEKRTAELHEKVDKLHNSEKAMLYMVEDLNHLTAQLKEEQYKLQLSNKELEAFSYSISHDLRAPLRHINSYIELLKEDFSTDLPEKAHYYLTTVTNSAKQMGRLIDDLLQFSRTGRQELQKTKIEMNLMVNEVVENIKQDLEKRDILWKLQELPEVFGDYSLLKQVWLNLIDNAVKYSSNTLKAEISISFKETEKDFVFYVCDNGVGFDMKYAHKLFGVFQRLHSSAEFEGTGIGLANVQRIIHKHNGQVWAEGEPNKGATFFFSLPKANQKNRRNKPCSCG